MTGDRERLQALFDGMEGGDRHALLAFAEFLCSRRAVQEAPTEALPRELPRPDDESVIAALKRLRATYPMLASAPLLDAATGLVTAHVLHGRPAVQAIDELETLFSKAYADHVAQREARP